MAQVLLVSKPVEPPWNDSSKNLVRDLATAMARHQPTVFGTHQGPALPAVPTRRVFRRGGFALRRSEQLRVLGELAISTADIWHFFFAPNRLGSRAASVLRTLRRRPTLHTLCSVPRHDVDLGDVLFADVNIVLSHKTERTVKQAGIGGRVERIPPAVAPLPALTDAQRAEARARWRLPDGLVVVYPGDLEFGRGARRIVEAVRERPNWHLVLACRTKTAQASRAKATLLQTTREFQSRVTWVGETEHILPLLGAADVVALPSDDLYAKMDYPLALLEAMSMSVPVIVSQGSSAAELEVAGAFSGWRRRRARRRPESARRWTFSQRERGKGG